jgi:carboxypeptidase C (cathepsin A)
MRFAASAACSIALLFTSTLGSAQNSAPTATTSSDAGDRPGQAPSASRDEPGRGDRTNALPGGGQRAERAQSTKLGDADIATAPIHEARSVTRHTTTIDGRTIDYLATAGTLTVRDDDGKPVASMFYVAYTAGGDGHGGNRPVTFIYNGGPGSSSMWLHMGSIAPMRVRTDSPQATGNAPFQLVPNESSLLDKSDLVFIDAMGAGFSRPLGDAKLQTFWGTDPDIDVFARAIERYMTENDRWNSPKFLFGESYGTTRSAGLSYRLAQDGAQLNGVILLSSILNYGRRAPGLDQDLINYIPSYAAIAAYHHRLPTAPADITAFLQQVRDWTRGPYAQALARGQDLPDAERQAIATQMAAYTGLSVGYILDNDLRVTASGFRKELLRDQRRTLGRYDARFEGIDVSAAGESPEYDASDSGITGAFVSSFHHYLARDLHYETDLTYRPTYYASALKWSFEHRPPGARGGGQTTEADVALDLSAAMRENPHLQVLSLNGLYDMATPFFGTEYDLGHMQLDHSLRSNLHFAYYPSGHMVYLNTDALRSMKQDLARFYDDAAKPAENEQSHRTSRR